jgi:hypothetical protein
MIFTGEVAINRHNSFYLMDLPVADMDSRIRISPFSRLL